MDKRENRKLRNLSKAVDKVKGLLPEDPDRIINTCTSSPRDFISFKMLSEMRNRSYRDKENNHFNV